MSGVLLKLDDASYEACATDGRCLALVTGPTANALDYPTIPEMTELPPSAPQAVIPRAEWQQAFKAARTPAMVEQPILGHVAVHLGLAESLLASTDGDKDTVARVANVEGRYPDYQAVLPRSEPQLRVFVNARFLIEVLKLAQQFGPEDERVTLELHGANTPMVVRSTNGPQKFVGLVMPLT
jgi:DNA polymerase III sliding clamp (beta) subunit (PCNA family)